MAVGYFIICLSESQVLYESYNSLREREIPITELRLFRLLFFFITVSPPKMSTTIKSDTRPSSLRITILHADKRAESYIDGGYRGRMGHRCSTEQVTS